MAGFLFEPVLSQAETVTDADLVVGREMVHLVEVLQTDTVLLGDGVHRLAIAHVMQTTLIVLGGLRLFLLQPDDLALFQLVALVALVILSQLAVADAHLVGNRAESVALARDDIVVLVKETDRMPHAARNMILRTVGHELVVVLGPVIFIEFIELDDLYQFAGVLGICGITCGLQSFGPALIVGLLQVKQRLVATAVDQEQRVILIRLIGRIVGTEALVALIIIMIAGAPRPSVTLDAEVVVGPAGEFAPPRPTLEGTLRQGDRGRNMILEHLLDGNVLILVEILLVGLVPFDLGRDAQGCKQGYDDEIFSHICD